MTIVVGVDGSPESYDAIRIGREEAGLRGTRLVAVMAYGSEGVLGTPAVRPLTTPRSPDEDRVMAESTLRSVIKASLGAEGGPPVGPIGSQVEAQVEAGHPGRVLVETARALDAVMIVLAARKEGSPARLLGAVSQYVLRNAPCPVLVVPEASKER
jgi:nucleotide-binding universal stress UspA family protein